MKNINYLEVFFKKHKLSGKIKVKYSSPTTIDEYMTDIIFENGDVVNINDIIFDIESDLPEDMYHKWMESRKENDMSFAEWIQTDNHYMPDDIDTTSVKEYQQEMTVVVDGVIDAINTVFKLETDEGDSDGSEDE